MTSRPSIAAPILAVLAVSVPLLVFVLYFTSYIWLGKSNQAYSPSGQVIYIQRHYRHQLLVTLYRPAGQIESWLRGIDVSATHDNRAATGAAVDPGGVLPAGWHC